MVGFRKPVLILVVLFVFVANVVAQKSNGKSYDIQVNLTDKATKEPIIMASCVINPAGIIAVTDADGKATIKNVPEGDYTLSISYVGYQSINTSVKVNKPLNMTFKMTETSLRLNEVTVTARQKVSGASTTTMIDRQAIDHLQANSLSDIMQLLPGNSIAQKDMTSRTGNTLQIRQVEGTYNNTNAFGAGLVLDGVPTSGNASMTNGQFSATAATGIDMRQVSADDIESVEVIRGIPSAEYGDLTSGLVVIHSKVGVTPWQLKSKINPNTMNYSLAKGQRLGKGVFNFAGDYAQSWGDPRKKTNSYHRYTLSAGYGVDFTKKWHTTTKLRFFLAREWSGQDPDVQSDGSSWKHVNSQFSLTHNGRLSLNMPLARTLNYTIGVNGTIDNDEAAGYVSRGAILTARETGYYSVPFAQTSYLAKGRTESRPGSVYAKINDQFFLNLGKVFQRFKVGVDYRYDWNDGKGYFNFDDNLPYKQNNSSRPRAFSDIPGMHQFSAFMEDNFRWQIKKHIAFKLQLGARFQSMQPWADEHTFAFSPRMNASLDLGKFFTIRGGVGRTSKAPGLNYLYPDKKYMDVQSGSYTPQNNDAGKIWIYHTEVFDVKRSEGLKNATTTKVELGFDLKLPGHRMLSVTAYRDRTPNGFSSVSEWLTYGMNYYGVGNGLTPVDGGATLFDPTAAPLAKRTMWYTSGLVGNNNKSVNRGVEFTLNIGTIKPINTTIEISGAYQESKSWTTNQITANPLDLTTKYTQYNTTPIKFVFPSGLDIDGRYRNFLNTVRIVTHLPKLGMVASFSGQVRWYNSSYSHLAAKSPIGWISEDLAYHPITADMLNGFIGEDGLYYATKDAAANGTELYSVSGQNQAESTHRPTKAPVTWFISARLTKEFGKFAGLSFFVNNCLFYEPYLKSSTTNTLAQRNTGTFSFGAELFFNL